MLVTGLLSILKSSPESQTATLSPKNSTGPEAPTSDSAQQTNHAENLPEELTGHIDTFLGAAGASDFSRTNRNNRQGSAQYFFKQRLKPEFQLDGRNFIKNFGDPAKRLDRYVPVDQVGRNYLEKLGISGVFTAKEIQKGNLTIEQALTMKARIDTDLSEYDWTLIETALMKHPIVRDCVVANKVQLNVNRNIEDPDALDLLKNSIADFGFQALINLASPVVQKYLYSGDMDLIEALDMAPATLEYLATPGVQEQFESQRHQMTLDLFLS